MLFARCESNLHEFYVLSSKDLFSFQHNMTNDFDPTVKVFCPRSCFRCKHLPYQIFIYSSWNPIFYVTPHIIYFCTSSKQLKTNWTTTRYEVETLPLTRTTVLSGGAFQLYHLLSFTAAITLIERRAFVNDASWISKRPCRRLIIASGDPVHRTFRSRPYNVMGCQLSGCMSSWIWGVNRRPREIIKEIHEDGREINRIFLGSKKS